MNADLVVVLNGHVAGHVAKTGRQSAELRYDPSYLGQYDPTPLSLAFPLGEHEHEAADWLDGLLPPSLDLRQAIGRSHGAASQHPVDLLCTPIGMDCAGAVQFHAPDPPECVRVGGLAILSDEDVENGLVALRRGANAWASEMGRPLSFSLSGAQTKVALRRMPDRSWALPFGDEPLTHILKISSPGWEGNDVIEHVCMQAVRAAGAVPALRRLQRGALEIRRGTQIHPDGDEVRRLVRRARHEPTGMGRVRPSASPSGARDARASRGACRSDTQGCDRSGRRTAGAPPRRRDRRDPVRRDGRPSGILPGHSGAVMSPLTLQNGRGSLG